MTGCGAGRMFWSFYNVLTCGLAVVLATCIYLARSPIKPQAMLPRVSLHTPLAMDGKGGLRGCTIVELSKGGVSSSSACALLADAGATVIKLEAPDDGDSWRRCNAASFAQFNRGKSSTVADLHDRNDVAAVLQLLRKSAVQYYVVHISLRVLDFFHFLFKCSM